MKAIFTHHLDFDSNLDTFNVLYVNMNLMNNYVHISINNYDNSTREPFLSIDADRNTAFSDSKWL